jgi:hypothetical protein
MGPHLPQNPLAASRCYKTGWQQVFFTKTNFTKKPLKVVQCTYMSLPLTQLVARAWSPMSVEVTV